VQAKLGVSSENASLLRALTQILDLENFPLSPHLVPLINQHQHLHKISIKSLFGYVQEI